MAGQHENETGPIWPENGGEPGPRLADERPSSIADRLATASQRPELLISLALRYGVLISSALIVFGMLALLRPQGGAISQSALSSALSLATSVETMRSPLEVLQRLHQGDPNALVALGLLVLILTPLAPVLCSLLFFWRERDRTFVAIALAVLVVLILGLFWVH